MKIGIDISGAAVRAAALDRSGRLITGGSAANSKEAVKRWLSANGLL